MLDSFKGTEKDNFEHIVSWLNDPELIQYWINKNISYKSEKINYGQSPKQTFKRKTGDCEDYAIFGVYCLDRSGYDSAVVTSIWDYHTGNNDGHSVGAFKKYGEFYKFADSNSRDIQGLYKSYRDIGQRIHHNVDVYVQTWGEALSANK